MAETNTLGELIQAHLESRRGVKASTLETYEKIWFIRQVRTSFGGGVEKKADICFDKSFESPRFYRATTCPQAFYIPETVEFSICPPLTLLERRLAVWL